jgi:hypothetical protein
MRVNPYKYCPCFSYRINNVPLVLRIYFFYNACSSTSQSPRSRRWAHTLLPPNHLLYCRPISASIGTHFVGAWALPGIGWHSCRGSTFAIWACDASPVTSAQPLPSTLRPPLLQPGITCRLFPMSPLAHGHERARDNGLLPVILAPPLHLRLVSLTLWSKGGGFRCNREFQFGIWGAGRWGRK